MKLEIKNLSIKVDGKEIIAGLDLVVNSGEICALMGPNGSGKSTLAYALAGHPKYTITKGQVLINEEDIIALAPYKRAALGLFLGFQYPVEVPGVNVSNFLRTAYNSINKDKVSVLEFHKIITEKANILKVDPSFLDRYLNEGFSGGEKKRAEILQLAVLNPKFAVLDETDSGLDVDSLKIVANGINQIIKNNKKIGLLLITHYQRILDYITPDKVYIMMDGKIVKSGGKELALEIEKNGYDWLIGSKRKLNVIS